MSGEQRKVDGQRAAIREHITKYLTYEEDARSMALRTIRNAQGFVEKIRAKAPSIAASWEDFWDPADPAPDGYEPPDEYQPPPPEQDGEEPSGEGDGEGEGEGEGPVEEPAEP